MQLSYEHELKYSGFQLLSVWILCISQFHLHPAPTSPPPRAAVALGRGEGLGAGGIDWGISANALNSMIF